MRRSMTWSTSRSATRRDLFRGWPFTWFSAAETSSDSSRRAEKSAKGIKLKTSFFPKDWGAKKKVVRKKICLTKYRLVNVQNSRGCPKEHREHEDIFATTSRTLDKKKDERLRCARKESFDQMSCWHPKKKTWEKKFWRHDRHEKNETLTTGRVGRRWRKILRPRSARFFLFLEHSRRNERRDDREIQSI